MLVMALFVVVPVVLALAVGLDHVTGRRVGWVLLLGCASWIAWPSGNSEQNAYGLFLGGFVALVLLSLYGLLTWWRRHKKVET